MLVVNEMLHIRVIYFAHTLDENQSVFKFNLWVYIDQVIDS